jgi:5-formyltetrahydrofolate cyclo-ligase
VITADGAIAGGPGWGAVAAGWGAVAADWGAVAAGWGAVDGGWADCAGASGGWAAKQRALAAAKSAPVINFDGKINAALSLRFGTMTGASRIPCGSSGLPDASSSVSGSNTDEAKKTLRAALKATRRSIDQEHRVQWDAHIGAQIVAWWRRRQPALLGVYWPMHGEPDLSAAYAELVQAGARLALPMVMERDAPLAFSAWTPGEPMTTDGMGLAVPATLRFTALPSALLVPCLGFNAAGYRLGYGGGFYDRTLSGAQRPATLGIAYACLEARFGHAAHDVPLDTVVTEATELS